MPAFAIEVFRLAVWLLLLSVIFVPLERLFPACRQPILRRQFAADLGYYFLNSLVTGALLAPPLALAAAAAQLLLPAALTEAIASLPGWGRLLAAVLVAETGFYWGHRWSHEIPLLWRFHSIHHSPDAVDFLTNSRAHPLDMVFARLCGIAPLYALGLAQGAATPALIVVLGTMWGFFIHANLRWRLGWLEWLVATPGFHRWHHTNDSHRDRNYAPLLPVLDVVFGTLYLPRRAAPPSYGIDTPMPDSLTGQLLHPLRRRRTREPAAPVEAA